MIGLILAAGMGKRLGHLTENNTKCMVRVNGVSLIERALRQLDALELEKIVLVVGYEGQKLKDYIATLNVKTPIEYVDNPVFDKTNNIYSLGLARDYLKEHDTLLLESDLIFEDSVLKDLIEDPRDTLALVDRYESWMDGTCITIGEDDTIERFIPGKKFRYEESDQYYKTVNIYKFSKDFSRNYYVPFLEAYMNALGKNEYYEQVLRVITMLDEPVIFAKRLNHQKWYEIDDVQDLDIAESIFEEDPQKKIAKFQSRYGGYWRYPALLDYCYLVNPYFPPKRLMDEMKANFERLLTQYPSGLRVNNLLASKNFGIDENSILVGNGAAELIKSIMERQEGKVGFIRPTFEEYPNRFDSQRSVIFIPQTEDFSYSADDLIEYFKDKDLSALVLINPDNPSGSWLDAASVKKVAEFTRENGIRLILDESFADFADDPDAAFLKDENLEEYPNMVIIKSISKSYGVPGVRLGIAATKDHELLAKMKEDVSIWNINSFGEFYLQIAEKYQKDYRSALEKFRKERTDFVRKLKQIKGLEVYPSQANYVMAKLPEGVLASEITQRLLNEEDIFIKDLSTKVHRSDNQYIRLAIRNHEDNAKLLKAFEKILTSEGKEKGKCL